MKKKRKFPVENVCFFLFMLKTYIVGTRYNRLTEAVQTSTHNLMFWSKRYKIDIPLHTPVLLLMGYTFSMKCFPDVKCLNKNNLNDANACA